MSEFAKVRAQIAREDLALLRQVKRCCDFGEDLPGPACAQLNLLIGRIQTEFDWLEKYGGAVELAKARYSPDDDVDVDDDNTAVDPADGEGCWVNAWLWVAQDELDVVGCPEDKYSGS